MKRGQDLGPQYICGGLDYYSFCLLGIMCYQPKLCFSGLCWLRSYCAEFLILFVCLQERAKELAETIGADAASLADLDNFHPEYGMILANTTSIGMQPKVDETPISKVSPPPWCCFFRCELLCISLNEKRANYQNPLIKNLYI